MGSSANHPCPCGSLEKYKRCCRPLHRGQAASSPEALMRSRYGGYCLGLVDYIMQSTAESAQAAQGNREQWRKDIEDFCAGTQFDSLEVLCASEDGDHGSVTFVARMRQGERDASFREESAFVRCAGRWQYLSGRMHTL